MYVHARQGEPFEELYRRFKRGIEASGLLREYRRKQRFIPAHEERRDKIRAAARKKKRALAKFGHRDRQRQGGHGGGPLLPVGVVDRIDERYGQHCVIVLFPTLTVPPFGTAWVDGFMASELVVV